MTLTQDARAGTPTGINTPRVLRVEVWPRPGQTDPRGAETLRHAAETFPQAGVHAVRCATVYLIESAMTDESLGAVAEELLADPVAQHAVPGAADAELGTSTVEVHYLPGVMDPVAESTADAIREMLPDLEPDAVHVRTGVRYDISHAGPLDAADLEHFAARQLGNPVIQEIHAGPHHPEAFAAGSPYQLHLTHIPIRGLDDAGLARLSREGHLFLSLDEMRAIQQHYLALPGEEADAKREPTDIELETFAQTWSEHCVHKTLKSTIRYRGAGIGGDDATWAHNKPGHETNPDGTVTIHNLLKQTVAAATFALRNRDNDAQARGTSEETSRGDWLVSVFDDNAGIVKLDDTHGIAIKVETHNHPSAIEPYGGAATGIGGCIRDIIGTGMAAKPIANTNTFAVAPPQTDPAQLPAGVIHPKRTLQRVVAGVRDYGNRMGIPTVNGAVVFHDDFVGNPLVFAGCVGLIPLDRCFGNVQPGDRIIALGGRTGRDGIHGATFSSAELTDTHADEFSHAVQIGNAITEKRTLDVILRARDAQDGPLFTAITDCGAGGFSSAVGEMGEKIGADVTLDTAPTKYDGLTYTEVWISEAQERMVLAVPAENLPALQALCDAEEVELCDLGSFGFQENNEPVLRLSYHGTQVGKLPMRLLHDGIPTPVREATWEASPCEAGNPDPCSAGGDAIREALLQLLGHPNIASKHWIVRQYDHEVQGGSVVKPLCGPEQQGPSDGAVLRPKLDSDVGIALACGLAPWLSEKTPGGDSYQATLHAIDEAVRNAVCVGADPQRIAILDNFCWPSCDDPENLGSLVRAAEACYDGAMAFGTPFVSGKDSLHNQFTTEDGRLITIPPTLLITALGIVPDVKRARTMDAKQHGHALLLVGYTDAALGGSHLCAVLETPGGAIPMVDLHAGPKHAQAVAALITQQRIASAHDCSDGGLLLAAAEMAFAGNVGIDLDFSHAPTAGDVSLTARCFAETPSRYLLEVSPDNLDAVIKSLRSAGVPFAQVGTFADHDRLTLRSAAQGRLLDITLDALRSTWRKPLDW